MSETRTRRHRIEIQRKVLTGVNSVGEPNFTWELLCSTWTQVGDGWATIRFHPGIVRGQRIVIVDGVFQIEKITDIPRR
jgi:hypothetical protein